MHKSQVLPVEALASCLETVEREFTLFCKLSSQQGWNLEKHLISVGDWRAIWRHEDDKQLTPSSLQFKVRNQTHDFIKCITQKSNTLF